MKKIIFSHDAGGAECLSAYLRLFEDENRIYNLSGPAIKIYKKLNLVDNKYKINLKNWSSEITSIVTSVSWENNDWFKALKIAKEKKINSTVMLDSWSDYRRIFGYPKKDWQINLPNNLIVNDKLSYSIIKKLNLDKICNVKVIENQFLNFHKSRLRKTKNSKNILFLSPPITKAKKSLDIKFSKLKLSQKDLLIDVVKICNKLNLKLFLRPHPCETKSSILKEYGELLKNVKISKKEKVVFEDFYGKSLVIGAASTALAYASSFGCKTISYEKSELNNIFEWEELGVYKFFDIKKITNYEELFKYFNSFIKKNVLF